MVNLPFAGYFPTIISENEYFVISDKESSVVSVGTPGAVIPFVSPGVVVDGNTGDTGLSGVVLGDTLGVCVGTSVGAALGDALGVCAGASVGAALGDALGVCAGTSVGAALGDALGVCVGASVGAALGDVLGTLVGVGVGVTGFRSSSLTTYEVSAIGKSVR